MNKKRYWSIPVALLLWRGVAPNFTRDTEGVEVVPCHRWKNSRGFWTMQNRWVYFLVNLSCKWLTIDISKTSFRMGPDSIESSNKYCYRQHITSHKNKLAGMFRCFELAIQRSVTRSHTTFCLVGCAPCFFAPSDPSVFRINRWWRYGIGGTVEEFARKIACGWFVISDGFVINEVIYESVYKGLI